MTTFTPTMSVIEAIYRRRAVRSYTGRPLDEETVHALLAAAVQAPTALHAEPWAFAVIQDKDMLDRLSANAIELMADELDNLPPEQSEPLRALLSQPDFNIFYGAGTLIVMYGRPSHAFVAADCWLAAENLMLAACSFGLGSCVIGFAVSSLNTPEWKDALGVPQEMTGVGPI